MLTPELQKIKETYQETLVEIAGRTHYAGLLHYEEVSTGVRVMDIETIATTFRKIAELIIFANLIGHENVYRTIHAGIVIEDEWNMGKIINRIKTINPNYYPVAWGPVMEAIAIGNLDKMKDEAILEALADVQATDVMSERELIEMYGECSDLIHAHNPLKGKLDYSLYLDKFLKWGAKITNLLGSHSVTLADGQHLLLGIMNPSDNPGTPFVEIYPASKLDHVNKKIRDRLSGQS